MADPTLDHTHESTPAPRFTVSQLQELLLVMDDYADAVASAREWANRPDDPLDFVQRILNVLGMGGDE